MAILFAAGASLLLVFWLFSTIRALVSLHRFEFLTPDSPYPLPGKIPLVSILVPARNEEEIVAECIRSLLAQDYPSFEVIAVNDGSTDRTAVILDALAKEASGKLRVLHLNGDLPPGWVGKHYALTLAVAQARGSYLLMSDADMIHEKPALSKAMGFALKNQFELVSLLPKADSLGFWERLIMPVWGLLLGMVFPFGEVNDPRKRSAIAAGGFILISRNAFDGVGGYSPAADHIVDDVLLAQRVKEAGFRIQVLGGEKLSRTRMYKDFHDLWEGVEKSAAPALDFRLWMLFASMAFLLSNVFIPVFGLIGAWFWYHGQLPNEWLPFTIVALILGAFLFLGHLAINIRMGIPPLRFALLAPLGYLLYAVIMFSSFFKGRFGKGVEWKGRRYYGSSKPLPKSKLEI